MRRTLEERAQFKVALDRIIALADQIKPQTRLLVEYNFGNVASTLEQIRAAADAALKDKK
jgi:hypothetical protein